MLIAKREATIREALGLCTHGTLDYEGIKKSPGFEVARDVFHQEQQRLRAEIGVYRGVPR